MSIFNWVSQMLGIDVATQSQYEYLVVAISGAILIILFSAIYTLLLTLGGLVSPRRH